jgi:hypothetical protein
MREKEAGRGFAGHSPDRDPQGSLLAPYPWLTRVDGLIGTGILRAGPIVLQGAALAACRSINRDRQLDLRPRSTM